MLQILADNDRHKEVMGIMVGVGRIMVPQILLIFFNCYILEISGN